MGLKSNTNAAVVCQVRSVVRHWISQWMTGVSCGLGVLLALGHANAAESSLPPTSSAHAQGGVEVQRETVSLFFATGDDQLPEGASGVLEELIRLVKAGAAVQVTGFHDASGSAQVNQALALARAKAVQTLLLRHGVPAGRIKVGTASPAADAPVTNAENRRVELKVIEP